MVEIALSNFGGWVASLDGRGKREVSFFLFSFLRGVSVALLRRLLIPLSSLSRSTGGALVGSASSLSSPLETLSSKDNRSPLLTQGVMRSSLHGCEFEGPGRDSWKPTSLEESRAWPLVGSSLTPGPYGAMLG